MADPDPRPGLALILGLGRFGGGREAARFLARRGWALRVADKAAAATLRESIEALDGLQVDWRLGGEDPAVLDAIDLVVVNPAVPDANPILTEARTRAVRITQEVGLFLEAYPGRTVLVTGTNGKSTTTTLLARALARAGVDALSGGNIGHSLLADEADWRPGQVAILEISSFQLERLDPGRHRVEGTVFTRITRDHLDRHGSLAAYHAAKAIAAACADDFVVHGADDAVAASFATTAARRLVHRRGPRQPGDAAWVEDGLVQVGGPPDPGPVLHRDALALIGSFHADNAMGAALAALECGADRHRVGLALAGQEPLPYRLQLAAVLDGVAYYDNAISTAAESTESALDSLRGRVHWVGGGKSKEGPGGYAAFAPTLVGRAATAHVFGTAAEPLAAELRAAGVPVSAHPRLEEALSEARQAARPGETVLFSPGFASFDQFPNFRARAEAFRGWLRGARDRPAAADTTA